MLRFSIPTFFKITTKKNKAYENSDYSDSILTKAFGSPTSAYNNVVSMASYKNTAFQYADGVAGLIETPNGDKIVYTIVPKEVIKKAMEEQNLYFVLDALNDDDPRMTRF